MFCAIRVIRVICGLKEKTDCLTFQTKSLYRVRRMKESTKKTLKRVAEIVITIITALLTTLGAHAAGIVQ